MWRVQCGSSGRYNGAPTFRNGCSSADEGCQGVCTLPGPPECAWIQMPSRKKDFLKFFICAYARALGFAERATAVPGIRWIAKRGGTEPLQNASKNGPKSDPRVAFLAPQKRSKTGSKSGPKTMISKAEIFFWNCGRVIVQLLGSVSERFSKNIEFLEIFFIWPRTVQNGIQNRSQNRSRNCSRTVPETAPRGRSNCMPAEHFGGFLNFFTRVRA